MSTVKKIPRKIFPIMIGLLALAGALGIAASLRNSSATTKPAATAESAEIETLLNEGKSVTAKGYFKATSSALVAAAAGDYDSKFYDLGKLLVRDGLGNTIIGLG